ncbi:hypothetical protein PROFUN_06924 [Planoprotostelium fungivorum]|uniref:F-box domain-containing protein n=1 Tax=Planoprotostelium fungivorum TaxID=1890364 RepID=A0A2P6NN11_9EUKA|nr:hypothetical protein PROFUN_06924 [Planoprotostelium fungivorum]
MQQLPIDLWNNIFSFLPTLDLCAPCFTSKILRDAACRTLDSHNTDIIHWHRYRKQLPTHNMEVVKWWRIAVREPTREEVMEATRSDQLDVVELLGWDDTELSLRHRTITRTHLCAPAWCAGDILFMAVANGSKKIITAVHERKNVVEALNEGLSNPYCMYNPLFGEEEDLEMMQWLCNEHVEGLPSVQWPVRLFEKIYSVGFRLAERGHRRVIAKLMQRIKMDDVKGSNMYNGAGQGGRIDMLLWLEENNVPYDPEHIQLFYFVSSMSTFEWALSHGVLPSHYLPFNDREEGTYEDALRVGCIENQFDLPTDVLCNPEITHADVEVVRSAIDDGYITRETMLQLPLLSTRDRFEMIQWMHERELLHENICLFVYRWDNVHIMSWLVERGYAIHDGDWIHSCAAIASPDLLLWLIETYDKGDEEMYDMLVKQAPWGPFNLPSMEFLLQRKWNESEEEVKTWMDDKPEEYLDVEWMTYLWENGRSL